MSTQSIVNHALANPSQYLLDLDKYESEQSLLNFMKLGWHCLEPGVEFVPNWGVQAVCDHLEAVTRGQIRRLLINVPPGCTKSMSTNVFWPAWEWGPMNLPHYRYISFAHEMTLATRDNVRCRSLINSDWYQMLWGDNFGWEKDQNGKEYYVNTATGFRQACAAKALTGRRGDRVIGDDPHSVKGADSDAEREEVLQIMSETVPTRLNKMAESAIVVIMQRVHERDVSGMILAEELGYEHLMLPMEFEADRRCYSTVKPSYIPNAKPETVYYHPNDQVWRKEPPKVKDGMEVQSSERYNVDIRENDGDLLDPKRYPMSSLIELKKALSSWGGTYAEAGQLQQRPAPRDGGLMQLADFNFIDDISDLFGVVCRGWDFAATDGKKSDWSVGAKVMVTNCGKVVIMDINRFKKKPGALEDELLATARADGLAIPIDFPTDPAAAGKIVKSNYFKLLNGYEVYSTPEQGDKITRGKPFIAQVEAGNVYILRAGWNDLLMDELTKIPASRWDDQFDAIVRAYNRCIKANHESFAGGERAKA